MITRSSVLVSVVLLELMAAGCQTQARTAPALKPLYGTYAAHVVGAPGSAVLSGKARVADGQLFLAFSDDAEETTRLLREVELRGPAETESHLPTACWGRAENHLGDGVQVFTGELRCTDSTQASITVLKGPLTPGVGVVRVDCNTIYDFVVGGLEEDVIELSQAREPHGDCSPVDGTMDSQSTTDEKGALGG